jgi:hypothetical protein
VNSTVSLSRYPTSRQLRSEGRATPLLPVPGLVRPHGAKRPAGARRRHGLSWLRQVLVCRLQVRGVRKRDVLSGLRKAGAATGRKRGRNFCQGRPESDAPGAFAARPSGRNGVRNRRAVRGEGGFLHCQPAVLLRRHQGAPSRSGACIAATSQNCLSNHRTLAHFCSSPALLPAPSLSVSWAESEAEAASSLFWRLALCFPPPPVHPFVLSFQRGSK